MKCPNCGTVNPPGEEFCENCGFALTAASSSGTSTTGASNIAVLSPTGNTNPRTTTGGGTSSGLRTLAPGSQLQGGRYVVEKVLGQGGMGAAVLAKDTRIADKLVVIKELIADSTDPQQRQEDVNNFRREVKTLTEIDHPLVPTVTDSFQEYSRYFMVQEYVAGENLEDHLARLKKPMPEREVLTYASQVLDILDYLSQLKPPIVHRDIKPANIIIGSKDKRAHLVDFGIARADEARNLKRKQTSALGTPGYAPPEQYQGNADPRSDLYALGATTHHLLTNREPRNYPPFMYPPVRTLTPQLSPEVERMIARAVNNDMTQRYQSAQAMKRDVDDILLKRFGISGNTSSYMLGTSGSMAAAAGAANAATYANPAMYAHQPTQVKQPPISPVPPPPAYQPGAMYAPPPRRGGGSNTGRNFLLFMIAIVLLGALAFGALNYLNNRGTASNGNVTPTATAATIPSSGIGFTKAANGESIGISDGTFSFDTSNGRLDGDLKKQAAQKLAAGDTGGAVALWSEAVSKDTNDAEALINLEN